MPKNEDSGMLEPMGESLGETVGGLLGEDKAGKDIGGGAGRALDGVIDAVEGLVGEDEPGSPSP